MKESKIKVDQNKISQIKNKKIKIKGNGENSPTPLGAILDWGANWMRMPFL